MRRDLAVGLVAGAAGTAALNVVTYLDMAVRGRGSSDLPAQAADRLAGGIGVSFGDGDTGENRKTGTGALLGYLTGLGVGAAYGVLRSRVRISAPVGAAMLGLAAMAGSDAPMAALGLTDPRTWGVGGWVSDLIPHLAYGVAAAAAYELLVV